MQAHTRERALRAGQSPIFFLAFLGACEGPPPWAVTYPPSAIVLIVDGVRTDEFCRTTASDLTGEAGDVMAAETWDTVGAAGSWSRAALNTGVTVTAPAHAAILTGRPEPYANFAMRADDGPGLYRPTLPTMFEAAHERLGDNEDDLVLLGNTELIEGLTWGLSPGTGRGAMWQRVHDESDDGDAAASDPGVLEALKGMITEGHPRLVVVNLHDVDRAGHYLDAPEYPARVADVDAAIADFWRWLQEEQPEYAASLLLVVTSDHGRHRPAGEEAWRNHGDFCDGCREIPMFIAGAGAPAGAELPTVPLLLDLAPTIAAHLGFAMPWAEGLPIEGLDLPDAVARSGEGAAAVSGALVATQVWRDDPDARSEITAGGAAVSTPGTLGAEAPAVVDGEAADLVCWRELQDTGEDRPWVPRCLADTGEGWADIGFAAEEASPYWEVALAESDGRVWAAWANNPHATADLRDGTVGMSVASWTASEGWSEPVLSEGFFPTGGALVADGEMVVGAYATSLGDPDGRYTRRIRVTTMRAREGVAAIGAETDFAADDVRYEHPALASDGIDVRLAMVAIREDGATIETATSADGGQTWTDPVALPGDYAPFVHLAPAWDGGDVVWAAFDESSARLCRAAPGAAAADCVDAGSPRVRSLSVEGGVATIVRDADAAAWERATITW